ncbi:hypothetical protein ACMHYB_34530 [Sorangium sp. So ce1128]
MNLDPTTLRPIKGALQRPERTEPALHRRGALPRTSAQLVAALYTPRAFRGSTPHPGDAAVRGGCQDPRGK